MDLAGDAGARAGVRDGSAGTYFAELFADAAGAGAGVEPADGVVELFGGMVSGRGGDVQRICAAVFGGDLSLHGRDVFE